MRIIDGDTVKVGGMSYRLAGIDAPENGQSALDVRGRRFDAGAAATNALSQFLDDMQAQKWQVDIVWHRGDLDRYQRRLAHIELTHPDGRTLDVCAWMVAEGWAVAEYGAQYRDLEHEARRLRRGLWSGEFERPKDWRRARRAQRGQPAPAAASPGWLWTLVRVLGDVLVGLAVIMLAIASASGKGTRYGLTAAKVIASIGAASASASGKGTRYRRRSVASLLVAAASASGKGTRYRYRRRRRRYW